MTWTRFTEAQPDIGRDYYWKYTSGQQVYFVCAESEAKYRALYPPKQTGEWSYNRPDGEVLGEP